MRQLLFTFNGRIARGQFWAGHLILLAGAAIVFLLCAVIAVLLSTKTGDNAVTPKPVAVIPIFVFFLAYVGVAIWTGVCLGIKRLHDRDKPAVWVCIQFCPFIGASGI